MDRIRMNGMDTYTPANLTCGACGVAIIKNGSASMPIYYKDEDGATYCPGCRADVELAREPEIECPACSGTVMAVKNMPGITGMCMQCGGLQLEVNHTAELASDWCHCGAEEQAYYWREATEVRRGAHGWLCTVCHGITQTG